MTFLFFQLAQILFVIVLTESTTTLAQSQVISTSVGFDASGWWDDEERIVQITASNYKQLILDS